MTSDITWYDVLGVLPDAGQDQLGEAWEARKEALAPGLLAGAAPDVLAAADRAREAADEAWQVLGDPETRDMYDQSIGFGRHGTGLASPRHGGVLSEDGSQASAAPQGPGRRSWAVAVPDLCGVFYHSAIEVAARLGLRLEHVRLTEHPQPVEGLVVGQAPAPGERADRGGTLTVRVWHPPQPGRG
ncbi:MAG: PASTA domain-containing protein [Gemmatimonadota bacterium]